MNTSGSEPSPETSGLRVDLGAKRPRSVSAVWLLVLLISLVVVAAGATIIGWSPTPSTTPITPLTEDVKLRVGTFSTVIPAGSFTQEGGGQFKFEGVIAGVTLEVEIEDLGGGSFEFKAEGEGANLTGTVNPVTVALTIGDDVGTTTITVELGYLVDSRNRCIWWFEFHQVSPASTSRL